MDGRDRRLDSSARHMRIVLLALRSESGSESVASTVGIHNAGGIAARRLEQGLDVNYLWSRSAKRRPTTTTRGY